MEKEKKTQTQKKEQVEQKETKQAETVLKTEYDKKVKELEELAEDYKGKWYRVSAEFDNYKKRTATAEANSYKNGKADVAVKILPVGDNLERALKMPLDEKSKEGIEMILKGFKDVLKNLDITEINPEGEKFDPNTSEAVMQAEGDESQSGNVATVFEKGYKMGDKVIRYAKVSVIK